jgi:AbrB family looped-hinge helix DNA binding protein
VDSARVRVRLRQRGTLTIPKQVRAGLPAGSELEVVRRDDGVIELRPLAARDPSQAWFWTERWQQMEREADADIAAGRVRHYDDPQSFLAGLGAFASE